MVGEFHFGKLFEALGQVCNGYYHKVIESVKKILGTSLGYWASADAMKPER